jgi:hypothetical protein
MFPDIQQGFLQDILGLFALAHQTQGHPVEHRPMLGDESFEGRSLLTLEGFHKFCRHAALHPTKRGYIRKTLTRMRPYCRALSAVRQGIR